PIRPPPAGGGGFDPGGLKRLHDVIEARVARGHIPGAAILLQRHGQRFEAAFGRQSPLAETPMTMDAIFRIYSMTKPVVSVAIMMLVEQGRLLISDPVTKHLPEFANVQVGVEVVGIDGVPVLQLEPCKKPMTIQDLLRHTAGLTYGKFGTPTLVKAAYCASGVEEISLTNDEVVSKIAALPLAMQPGTCWEYSRATDVLGALLERLCGQPLDVVLHERIFAPLGMNDTGFWVEPAKHARIAEAFEVEPDQAIEVQLHDIRTRPLLLSGGGGLVSTARDYLRFAQMLANGGVLEDVRLLSRKTVAFMTADHLAVLPDALNGPAYLPGPGYGFGLGFAVRTHAGGAYTPGSVGDFNWSGLAGTYFWIDPQEDLIAIWLMQAPEQRDAYRQLIRYLVAGCLR
ncbi:MAG: serine hydrolase domain-containing protein, partial [Pseudomonadota bacterium]